MINLVGLVCIFIGSLVGSVTLRHLDVLHTNHIGSLGHVAYDTIASIIVIHVLGLIESIHLTHEILELAIIIWNAEVIWATDHILLLILHLAHCLIKNSLFYWLHCLSLYLVVFVLLVH